MKQARGTKEIFFDGGMYSREAVRLAAYVFSRKCGVKVAAARGGLKALLGGGQDLDRLAGEFANEVLNQQCRLDLAAKNSKIANIIVTKALLSACGERGTGA